MTFFALHWAENWTSANVLTFFFALHFTLGGKQTALNCAPPLSTSWARPYITFLYFLIFGL